MPSNEIVINGSEELTFEVPDSFMPPLMAYLKMVKEKTEECTCDTKDVVCSVCKGEE